jgi:hypothetical protein
MSKSPARCAVKDEPSGVKITPCVGLRAAMTTAGTGAGARLETFINMGTGAYHRRLVVRPMKKEGKGIIANFCPVCGTILCPPDAGGFAKKENDK